jgi:type I restriction enzyme R subunit
VKSENTVEKASILNDVDFELELIHRDVINVQYILQLLARLYNADTEEAPKLRKLILDSVTGDVELRSKAKLIEKFIEDNLPKVGSEAEIPDSFEAFWEKERVAAFDQLVAEEDLDADKLKKVIDRYVYTGQAPLPDPDIAEIILKPMKVMERGLSKKRVYDRVVDYVATFIKGIAA